MASVTKAKPTVERRPSRGSQLLEKWRNGRHKSDLVQILGIDYSALSAFETGYRVPGTFRANLIEALTDGAIPAESWSQPPLGRRKQAA